MAHIPINETTQLTHLPFDEALREAEATQPPGWLFVPPFYAEYRYILGTTGKKPLICVGINPSTAAPDALDNTLKSVNRIRTVNGFDSFLMLNLYPQRATSPNHLDKFFNLSLHKENLKALQYCLSLCGDYPTLWVAWGTVVEKRPYLSACLIDFVDIAKAMHAQFVCAGKITKAGHPHHPLYLRKDEPFYPFDINQYLEKFRKN
ncbi:MAG: DUF1643 domain-containing protein [Christensenellales bacterium]|jgi:hypothetical protein